MPVYCLGYIMYAIIKAGGKQFKVKEGDFINVDHLKTAEAGNSIELKEVLLITDENGVQIGQPYLPNASVQLSVVRQFKGPKLRIIRYRRRTGMRRLKGYRHYFTEVKIEKIQK